MGVNHEIRNLIEQKELLIGRRDSVTTTRGRGKESIERNSFKLLFSLRFLADRLFRAIWAENFLFVKVFTENLLKFQKFSSVC